MSENNIRVEMIEGILVQIESTGDNKNTMKLYKQGNDIPYKILKNLCDKEVDVILMRMSGNI